MTKLTFFFNLELEINLELYLTFRTFSMLLKLFENI